MTSPSYKFGKGFLETWFGIIIPIQIPIAVYIALYPLDIVEIVILIADTVSALALMFLFLLKPSDESTDSSNRSTGKVVGSQ